jgi:periplasmic protein TonB
MRGWTLGVSIVIHLCIITGVIVKPLFATGELPEPPRASEWVMVVAKIPAPPRDPSPVKPTSASTAPLEAPDAVTPEPPAPPAASPGPTDFDVPGGDPLGGPFVPGGVASAGDPLPPPPPPPPVARPVYRVGGDIKPPQKIRDVAPRYPQTARSAHVQGIVILEATIGEDGSVRDVKVLRGTPLLDNAAVEAVRQWLFTPPMLNGQAVPAAMTVTVSFRLN